MGIFNYLHTILLLLELCLGFATSAEGFLAGQASTPRGGVNYDPPNKAQARVLRNGVGAAKTSELRAFFRPDWQRRFNRGKREGDDDQQIKDSLEARVRESERRIVGRKYICRNPYVRGGGDGSVLNVYLNIPEDDAEAQDETNIIHRLEDGEIVTSTGPYQGYWIEHNAGGWSPLVLDGITRLEPIEENSFQ